MRNAILPAALLALAACAATPPPGPSGPPLAWAKLDETVYVDGPKITPREVLEDSRCPAGVQCVWAGRVRIKAQIHLGNGDQTRELTLGEPIGIADGSLELVEVRPQKGKAAIPDGDYRFGFRFMGGL